MFECVYVMLWDFRVDVGSGDMWRKSGSPIYTQHQHTILLLSSNRTPRKIGYTPCCALCAQMATHN